MSGEKSVYMEDKEVIEKVEKSIQHAISVLTKQLHEHESNKSITIKAYTNVYGEAQTLIEQICSLKKILNEYRSIQTPAGDK